MTARYQYGTLTPRKRNKGPDVWQFRWMENGKPKSVLIGTVNKYQTRADAERAVEHLRIKINADNQQQTFHAVTVGALIDRFLEEHAYKRCRKNTAANYESLLNSHIRPQWGSELVQNVKAMAVEDWLGTYPRSRQVKVHIRTLMHILFQSALRWEMVDRNPISLVRQSGKRLKTPRALTPEEFQSILSELAEPYRTMVVAIACLGLRVSELVALQWGDIDFSSLIIKVQRGFVRGEINPTKTEPSEGILPLDPGLAEVILAHRRRAKYVADTDLVFANRSGKPRWPESILADYIKLAAQHAGIGKVGWHTFRHTYSTLLHALGTKPAVQKELLRHADIRTTMNVYTHALSYEKREAASKVVRTLYQPVLK
jgi:integrase